MAKRTVLAYEEAFTVLKNWIAYVIDPNEVDVLKRDKKVTIENLFGLNTQTVDGVTIKWSQLDSLVTGHIQFDTECKNDKSLDFSDLPAPAGRVDVLFKNSKFEGSINTDNKLNVVRRDGWNKEFTGAWTNAFNIIAYGESIYLINRADNKIFILDLNGNTLGSFAGAWTSAYDVSAYNGELYVADDGGSKIYVTNLQGTALRNFSVTGTPTVLKTYKDEVFVDVAANTIKVYDTAGVYSRDITVAVANIAVLDVYNDEIYVTDASSGIVYVYDLAGAAVRNFNIAGGPGWSVSGLEVYNDEVFITDSLTDKVYIHSITGTALRNFGGVGSGPFCITVLDDEVFVPDSATQTIFVKPVQTDDAAPEEAYKIKASVPFSYVAS